jgi:hypothetical protein
MNLLAHAQLSLLTQTKLCLVPNNVVKVTTVGWTPARLRTPPRLPAERVTPAKSRSPCYDQRGVMSGCAGSAGRLIAWDFGNVSPLPPPSSGRQPAGEEPQRSRGREANAIGFGTGSFGGRDLACSRYLSNSTSGQSRLRTNRLILAHWTIPSRMRSATSRSSCKVSAV